MTPFIEAALKFGQACEASGVAYFLGGSAATTFHGEPRMTNDLDFVIDADELAVARLVVTLGVDFESDVDALRRAARQRSSWNVFYLPDFTKVDVFFLRTAPYDQLEFARRRPIIVPGAASRLWVKAPEDSVLRKLCWFRDGGGTSERQWRDVVMVLRANAGRLDETHLEAWAGPLGVDALLAHARLAAAVPIAQALIRR